MTQTETTIVAVVADMDGTLLDTEFVAKTTWREAASSFGFDLNEELFTRLLGTNQRDTNAILAGVFGAGFDPETFYPECSRQSRLYMEANGIPVKAGARELFDWLAELGLPRAVATSSNREDTESLLGRVGLLERFDVLVTGDVVTHGKPHPEIFLRAAEALGVAPEQCVALEDSSNGVRSARAAGMVTYMIPDLVQPTDEIRQLAHRVFPSLLEVRDHLQMTLAAR